MRKIALFMNITCDGYFEGPNHDISFFKGDNDDSFAREQTQGPSTILLGHRTYDLMKSYWPTYQAKESSPEVAKAMNEMPKIVASHESFEPGWENVTVISGNVPEEIKKLKEKPGSNIIILGSNNLTVNLMQEGLIDEYLVMVNPVVIGEGTPLFAGLTSQTKFKLVNSRKFDSGNVLLTYEKT